LPFFHFLSIVRLSYPIPELIPPYIQESTARHLTPAPLSSQLGLLELRGPKLLLLNAHSAEDLLSLGLLPRNAGLDLIFALLVLAAA
jgi:hypothetical protein